MGSGISLAILVTTHHKRKFNARRQTGIGTSPVTGASLHPQRACAVVAQIGVTILPQAALHRDWEYSAASATGATLSSANVFRTTAITITTTAHAADATGAVAHRQLSMSAATAACAV